jgi:hypothetical protein
MGVRRVWACVIASSRRTVSRALAGAMLVAVGCANVPAGAGLLPATPASGRVDKGAWLAKVAITDPKLTNRDTIEEALTLSTAKFVGEAGYFTRINTLPGKPRPDDYLLRLTVDRYRQSRSVHPAYFPAAFVTMTLYIWFGGPIFRDTIDLSGTLVVDSPDGARVTEASDSRKERHNVSFWSTQYALPSGIDGRTAFIKALFDKAAAQLRELPRATPHDQGGDQG